MSPAAIGFTNRDPDLKGGAPQNMSYTCNQPHPSCFSREPAPAFYIHFGLVTRRAGKLAQSTLPVWYVSYANLCQPVLREKKGIVLLSVLRVTSLRCPYPVLPLRNRHPSRSEGSSSRSCIALAPEKYRTSRRVARARRCKPRQICLP